MGLPAVLFNPHPSWAESSMNLPVRNALTHKPTAPQSIVSGQTGVFPRLSRRGPQAIKSRITNIFLQVGETEAHGQEAAGSVRRRHAEHGLFCRASKRFISTRARRLAVNRSGQNRDCRFFRVKSFLHFHCANSQPLSSRTSSINNYFSRSNRSPDNPSAVKYGCSAALGQPLAPPEALTKFNL